MKDKQVLITGASRGIGKATAIELARQDFHVVLNYRQKEASLQETIEAITEFGGEFSTIGFDISHREECGIAISEHIKSNSAFYGVVCNAGICSDAPFPALSGENWDKVVHTNLDGFYNVIHPLVMPMIQAKQGGRIITLSSVAGIAGNRGQVNYSASKAGIIGASKALALELAKRKITVNCIAPGIIETDMTQSLPLAELKKIIPMQRLGKPEEVASLTGFLFSNQASYITGQVISINGGMI